MYTYIYDIYIYIHIYIYKSRGARQADQRQRAVGAADEGHMEVVTALLAAGADINLQTKVRNCWLRRVRVRGRVRGRGHMYAGMYGCVRRQTQRYFVFASANIKQSTRESMRAHTHTLLTYILHIYVYIYIYI